MILLFSLLSAWVDDHSVVVHSSGCKHGPRLRNVTLSSTFDDYLNM